MVVEFSEDGGEVVFEVFYDGWLDFVDVTGFLGVVEVCCGRWCRRL